MMITTSPPMKKNHIATPMTTITDTIATGEEMAMATEMVVAWSVLDYLTKRLVRYSVDGTEQLYDANDPKLEVFDATMSPKMKESLQHIINEMIHTEDDYVSSLEYVLQNYLPEL